ncbi:ribonuclease H-like domain-containing protein, partial [Tanacetum coccineum]
NRVLVTKPHNKTPYELLLGRPPSINFMRSFGCPVTILNTLDPLGKFDGKANEEFLVGYSINSKAFRVFNFRTKKVEENLHINFLENKPNVAGSDPEWLFDIYSLTKYMNYEPVTAGNQTNDDASKETNVNVGQAGQEKASDHEYILLPLMLSNSPLFSSTQSTDDKDDDEVPDKGDDDVSQRNGQEKEGGASNKEDDQRCKISELNWIVYLFNRKKVMLTTLTEIVLLVHLLIPNDSSMKSLENTGIFDDAYDDKAMGAEDDLNNLETTINVSPVPITRIHKDHPKDQIIGDINSATQIRRMTKISKEHAMKVIQALTDPSWIEAMQEELLQFKLQKVWTLVDLPKGKKAIGTKRVYRNKKDERGIIVRNKIDMKSAFLYGTIEEEVAWYETLSTYLLENRYRRGTIDKTLFIKKDRDDTQEIPDEFYRGAHFLLRIVSTTEGGWNLHQPRQVSSRPDITFSVCACARFQVTPKVSHLHVVKRIFRYLKGQPKLGLWYPRDLPFDLEAFSNSDYAGASLDKKSTIGGCQFIGKRLISWQYKKQTIVVNSTTEAEYVAAANCYG